MSALKASLWNTFWLSGERVLQMMLSLLVGIWVARYLEPGRFGELAYALAYCGIFQAATLLGMDSIVVRDIAQSAQQASRILGTVIRLRVMLGVVGWGLAVSIMSLLRPGDTTAFLLVVIMGASMVFQASETIDLWFQSQSQSRRTVFARVMASILTATIKLMLIATQASLVAFAVAQAIEAMLAAFFLAHAYRRFPVEIPWRWNSQLACNLLRQSWPLALAGITYMIYMRVDQIMLRQLSGAEELGLYSAALAFSQTWGLIAAAMAASTLPHLARLHRSDERQYRQLLQRATRLLFWFAVVIVLATMVFAEVLVSTLLGPAFQGSADILKVHVFSILFVFGGALQGPWEVTENRMRLSLVRTIIGATTSILLNFALIPHYGAMGAAMVAIITQIAVTVVVSAALAPTLLRLQIDAIFSITRHRMNT